MLSRALIGCILVIVPALSLWAEESAPETSIRIYRVGDLVSAQTVQQEVTMDHISPEAWQAEHAKTTESLERLKSLVESLCSTKLAVIEPYPETLSLIVRHTSDGHREIDQFLNALRVGAGPEIRLTCLPLCELNSSALESLPPEKQGRAEFLLIQKILTPDETEEVRELFSNAALATMKQTVEMVVGRKASWGIYGRPASATARIVPGKREIQLRLDYVVDDIGETMPVAAQVFEIPEGHSVISHHTCDGGTVAWLISPSIIKSETASDKAGTKVADNSIVAASEAH